MEETNKEVYFDQHCKTCKFNKRPEKCDPCCECLANFCREESHKPIYWEEK